MKKCVYCQNDNEETILTKDFIEPYKTNGTKIVYENIREYLCLICHQYYWWRAYSGLVKDRFNKEKIQNE